MAESEKVSIGNRICFNCIPVNIQWYDTKAFRSKETYGKQFKINYISIEIIMSLNVYKALKIFILHNLQVDFDFLLI